MIYEKRRVIELFSFFINKEIILEAVEKEVVVEDEITEVEVTEEVEAPKEEELPEEVSKLIQELKNQFFVWKPDKKEKYVIWIPKCKSSCKLCYGKGIVTGQFVEKGERFDSKHPTPSSFALALNIKN